MRKSSLLFKQDSTPFWERSSNLINDLLLSKEPSSPNDVLLKEDAIKAEESLRVFIAEAWHVVEPATEYLPNWHIDAIADHLEAASRGEIRNLLITMPPRCAKSLVVSVFWPTWMWTHTPSFRWLFSSFAMSLSIRDSLKCRRVIDSNWYQSRWKDRFTLAIDQNAKCLVAGTPIVTSTGEIRAIENIRSGDRILSIDHEDRLVEDTVLHIWITGKKAVKRLTLSDGTTIGVTLDHRLYGWNSWIHVRDMKIGDPVAVLRQLPQQNGALSKDDAFLLALWLAEGSKAGSSFEFTTASDSLLCRVREIAKKRGWQVNYLGEYRYTITADSSQCGDTPMGVLKIHLGSIPTYGKRSKLNSIHTDTIRIPDAIFQAPDHVVREFIGTYISCDGTVTCGKNHGLEITSISRNFIQDFSLLLRRFGVRSRITSFIGSYSYKGEKRNGKRSYRIGIMAPEDIVKLNAIIPYGKEIAFLNLLMWCQQPKRDCGSRSATIPPAWQNGLYSRFHKRGWASRQTVLNFATEKGHSALVHKLQGDLDWRSIVNIEDLGEIETWHLETEQTHMFFANGMLSHNSRFENDKTGYRYATSVGATVIGEGGNAVVCDDPMDVIGAYSETTRKAALIWWDQAMSTRLNDQKTGIKVIVQQRLHEEDLAGHVLKQSGYEHLNLPMEYEPTTYVTSLGWRDPRVASGELLWPTRFGVKEIVGLKESLGSAAYAGQFQQRPTPLGGGIVKLSWFKRYTVQPEKFIRIIQSWDTANKARELNDPWACTTWGEAENGYYLLDCFAKRMEYPEGKRTVISLAIKWNPSAILVEDKSSGMSVIQDLKQETLLPVLAIEPENDKITRMSVETPTIESGRVWIPETAQWLFDFESEISSFPNGSHDDICFIAGTKIATPCGDRNIEDIQEGDRVITPLGIRKVIAAGPTGERIVIQKNGLTATPNHPIFTFNNGFVNINTLSQADHCDILSFEGLLQWKYKKLLSLMESNTDLWGKEGIISASQIPMREEKILRDYMSQFMNIIATRQFLKAGMSTIKMGTLLITTIIIWSVYRASNIIRDIGDFGKTQTPSLNIWRKYVFWLQNGINPKKGENGTVKTASRRGKRSQLGKIVVDFAKSIFPQKCQQIFAPLSNPTIPHGLQRRAAESVEFNLETIADKQVVYNLTIEHDHVYYANGILVGNCDSVSQALKWLTKRQKYSFVLRPVTGF